MIRLAWWEGQYWFSQRLYNAPATHRHACSPRNNGGYASVGDTFSCQASVGGCNHSWVQ